MNTKQIVTAIVSTVLKIIIAVVVVILVYKGATIGYDYGYRIFKEEPMTESPGVNIDVEITMGKSTMQIGELLVNKGLIRDARLFYIQNFLSQYKNALKPGTYTLNTSMTMSEMMAVMSPKEIEETTPEPSSSPQATTPETKTPSTETQTP